MVTIVTGGEYRRAPIPKETLLGEGETFATRRHITQDSCRVDRTRKADELFATLQLIAHTPAVWDPLLTCNKTQKDYLVRDSPFAWLPGDDLRFQGPAPQVLSALEVLTSVFGMGTGGTPPA